MFQQRRGSVRHARRRMPVLRTESTRSDSSPIAACRLPADSARLRGSAPYAARPRVAASARDDGLTVCHRCAGLIRTNHVPREYCKDQRCPREQRSQRDQHGRNGPVSEARHPPNRRNSSFAAPRRPRWRRRGPVQRVLCGVPRATPIDLRGYGRPVPVMRCRSSASPRGRRFRPGRSSAASACRDRSSR